MPQRPRSQQSQSQSCASHLADRAVEALIAEALLTPKPALVDQRGSGAHRDLDLSRVLRSARALHGAFLQMAVVAGGREPDRTLRERLALIGRAGEADMLAATGGSNAHRGAIWVIGLLVAARAMGPAPLEQGEPEPKVNGRGGTQRAGLSAREIAARAARIAILPDRYAPPRDSHGARACLRYGVRGARGEASAGFPHVVDVGLPALWAARARGADEDCARLDALMAIMARLDDTCLLHRGGRPALDAAQDGARVVLAAGGSAAAAGRRALLRLDADLKARNASPGGCADLLAACLFLDHAQPRTGLRRDTNPIR
jgi:triphosphoribosyl-dephospho-CoA synthase